MSSEVKTNSGNEEKNPAIPSTETAAKRGLGGSDADGLHLATNISAAIDGHNQMFDLLNTIVLNARLIPDPSMNGATDVYAVPLSDIEAADILLGSISERIHKRSA